MIAPLPAYAGCSARNKEQAAVGEITRIAVVQTRWLGSRAAMKDEYRDLVAQAAHGGAALVCLPELSLSPYFPARPDPSGFDWAEPLDGGESALCFSELARVNAVTLIGSLFEKADDGIFRNTAVIYGPDGQRLGLTRKVHIPSGEGYHETDFFVGGTEYPVHDLDGLPTAVPTCYDQWFPELARIYALNGAAFIFYPTAIGSEPTDPSMDSQDAWRTVMRGHAIANGVYVAAANRTGAENGLTFYGGSFICAPTGEIIAQAGRDTREVLFADLDLALMRHWRGLFPLLHQRKPQVYGRIVEQTSTDVPSRWRDHPAFVED
ncbi:MAG: hydrolase [Chloroflexi bacterium]|nr:hydrolase [Chloroflexota bacterium]